MAETTVVAPATHSQPSRKGKKAWRKNVDIGEVQRGLDDAREEIIKTGGIIAEKPTDLLFATDVTGDAEVEKQQQGKKLLKADEILALRSAVPGLDGRKRKATEAVVVSDKRQKNGKYIPHRELQRLKAVADGANGGILVDDNAAHHDPWAVPKETKNLQLNFLDQARPTREPKTLKHAPISLTADGKRVPNVRRPDAAKSYNPEVNDYTTHLEREGAAAVSTERTRLEAEAKAEARETRALEEAAKVEAAEKEEYATDYDSAWESEWDGFQSEPDESYTQQQKGRKTPMERNKVKARKQREALGVHEQKVKERQRQEKKIVQIAKEVSTRDKARKAHAIALQRSETSSESEDGVDVQLQRQRFGKVPVPEAPLEVMLPEELEDSLRRLKPQGNLMQERYRNILVSGKLEARKRQWQHKQVKTTRSEKWSYKDWRLK